MTLTAAITRRRRRRSQQSQLSWNSWAPQDSSEFEGPGASKTKEDQRLRRRCFQLCSLPPLFIMLQIEGEGVKEERSFSQRGDLTRSTTGRCWRIPLPCSSTRLPRSAAQESSLQPRSLGPDTCSTFPSFCLFIERKQGGIPEKEKRSEMAEGRKDLIFFFFFE